MPTHAENFDYEAVLEACARGERFALRALYEREARWLLAVAQRILRDPDMAQDVLQEAFILVWQRAATYKRSLGSARGWIYTVVRHRALDEARRAKREVFVGDDLEALSDRASLAVDAESLPHTDAESLQRCLDKLEENRRQCIVSAFVEGYTHDQIAAELSTPVGTVKSWIRRGLLALKECLA
ncbi:MAG: sigma-70 family RNA polymerase sigma factor [Gammaproteobacteria bacterium]|nr:sigma-70 family RNA polymerase sigma factor [Gammaproteobacteria bacterium]